MPASSPLKLFIIYAREDLPALLELKAHLRPLEKRGDLAVWYDGEILPGQDWGKAIKEQLATSDIVMLFISKHFFSSEYIEKEELRKALERHNKGEAMMVPVIVKPCLWEAYPEISALQALPKDGKAVSSWREEDEAWMDVARGMQKLVVMKRIESAIRFFENGNANHKKAFEILLASTTYDFPLPPRAYNIIGWVYLMGLGGIAKNYQEAIKWCLKAAEKGNINAQTNLGFMFESGGFGIEKDLPEAIKWYKLGAAGGHAWAKKSLERLSKIS